MREKTAAHRQFTDDVPEETKQQRLLQLNDRLKFHQSMKNQEDVGRLVNEDSYRSAGQIRR